jgi:hypothetical protein
MAKGMGSSYTRNRRQKHVRGNSSARGTSKGGGCPFTLLMILALPTIVIVGSITAVVHLIG